MKKNCCLTAKQKKWIICMRLLRTLLLCISENISTSEHTRIHTKFFLFFFSLVSLLVTTNWKKKVSRLTFVVSVCVVYNQKKMHSSVGFSHKTRWNLNLIWVSWREIDEKYYIYWTFCFLFYFILHHTQFTISFSQCHANSMIQSYT